MKEKNNYAYIIQICMYVAVLVAFSTLIYFIDRYIDGFLNYDLSAELINGKVIMDEGSIIAKDWFYSTEIRLLNIPLVFSVVIRFIKSWHLVRVVSSAILTLILACGMAYCASNFGLKRTVPIAVIFCIIPFSPSYLEYVLAGLYYMPYVANPLYVMGLLYALKKSDSKKRNSVILTILCVFSLLIGVGGFRMILTLYLPILITVGIMYLMGYKVNERTKPFLIGVMLSFLSVSVGVVINLKLHSVYTFQKQTLIFKYMNMSDMADGIINPILKCYGFADVQMDLWSLARNSFCAMSFILTVISLIYHIKTKKEENVFLSVYYIVAMTLLFILFLFTEQDFYNRYYFPILIFSIILILKMFEEYEEKKLLKNGVLLFYLIIGCMAAFNVYKIYKYHDITKELRSAEEFLMENGYYNGYATGYYADPITELSDGQIEVWKWMQGDTDHQKNIDDVMQWLQKKSHQTDRPAGRVFILLDREEYAIIPFRKEIKDYQIFENERYYVFGFEDYNECKIVTEQSESR